MANCKMSARRLNDLRLEDGAACVHCDAPFEKPYDRHPEMETLTTAVLCCPRCGNFTVFHDSRFPERKPREPGED